jgi:hypothetical protein
MYPSCLGYLGASIKSASAFMSLTPSQHQLLAAEIRDLQKQIAELLGALKFMLGDNPAFANSYEHGLEKAHAIADTAMAP